MPTSPPPSPITAISPFDNVDADVILRSSDGIDFRVFKVMLSLVSPVFKTMFTLPQPSDSLTLTNSPPVIELPEDGDTLDAILLLCYPGTSPAISSLQRVWKFAAALVKYDMEVMIGQAKEIILSHFLEKSPISVYALGCHYGWKDVAERAAVETLKIKDLGRTTMDINEMENMTAAAYQRLILYHMACGVAAQKVATGQSYSTSKSISVDPQWQRKVPAVPLGMYQIESGQELLSRPTPSTLYDPACPSFPNLVVAVKPRSKDQAADLEVARLAFFKEVQDAVSFVKLDFKP